MKLYKHYSFDLWMTLIRSNPGFKQERTRFFHRNFNTTHLSIEEIALVFRKVDLMCNSINEKTGGNIDAEEMYLMVISMMNNGRDDAFDSIDTHALYNEMEALVFAYLPIVYDTDTLQVLNTLKDRSGTTFSLLSNTAFIKGNTLRQVLEKIGLSHFFDFQLYSDEEGMSKPNKKLFRLLLDKIMAYRNDTSIEPAEIIHIGDNKKADIAAATEAGISNLLINSNNLSILSLLGK